MKAQLKSDHILAQESCCDSSVLLNVFDEYKVLAIQANNGITSASENRLPECMIVLLKARRLMKEQQFEQVIDLLTKTDLSEDLLSGDRHFILSLAFYRLDNLDRANSEADFAIRYFKLIDDPHRLLRMKINKAIYNQNLESLVKGDLFFLYQNAKRIGAEDLCGNIAKSKSIELAKVGMLNQSLMACDEAIQSYETAGCPEDLNVAYAMKVIVQNLMGNALEASLTFSKMTIFDGKVKAYLDVINNLKNELVFALPQSHPLYGLQIVYQNSKRRSVTGKIVDLLRKSSLSRAELVSQIWGEGVDYDSHCNRLYVAINRLRTKMGVNILFDGEKYQLIQGDFA